MRIAATLLLLGSLACALQPDWRPKEGETPEVGDPRLDAVHAYNDADVMIRVHAYLSRRIRKPGDEADLLLDDFQRTTLAKLFRALDFLEKFPDDDFSARVIRCQVASSSVWEPWKIIALEIFQRAPKSFRTVFASLSAKSRRNLVLDVAAGIGLATDPNSAVTFRLSKEEAERLTERLQEFRKLLK
jgi:hypothetical protein